MQTVRGKNKKAGRYSKRFAISTLYLNLKILLSIFLLFGIGVGMFSGNAYARSSSSNKQREGSTRNTTDNQSFVIQRISVIGNKRVEKNTIVAYLTEKIGDAFSSYAASKSIKALYATSLFKNASISFSHGTLFVSVEENPIVDRVFFEDNDAISSKDLSKEMMLSSLQTYRKSSLILDVEKIKKLYKKIGYYDVSIKAELERLPENRVNIVYIIHEGPVAYVQHISFNGNNAFSDDTLRSHISTKEWAWWRFFSSSDIYDSDRLSYDQSLIQEFYANNGYPNMRVILVKPVLSNDFRNFYITFDIDEGDFYTFGKSRIETKKTNLDLKLLENLIQNKEGQAYNTSVIRSSMDKLSYQIWSSSDPFVTVNPSIYQDKKNKQVDVAYKIVDGPHVYVEKININGNNKTYDSLIRRKLRLSEGDAYNHFIMNKSIYNLRALGYFSSVDIQQEPGSKPDLTILNVNLKEKNTGSFQIRGGYSTLNDLFGNISISEGNFLGLGQRIGASFMMSRTSHTLDLSFSEPYLLGRHISLNSDVFYTDSNYQSESSYSTSSYGFSSSVGFPVSENGSLSLSYRLSLDNIYNVPSTASTIIAEAAGHNMRSIVGTSYYYDHRDDPISPKHGYDMLLGENIAGLGGSIRYSSTSFTGHAYHEFAKGYVASLRLSGGYIQGLGMSVNLNDRFFKGGYDFRGFDRAGIGPRDIVTGDALGAKAYVASSWSITIPNGLPKSLGMTTSLFTDFGYVGLTDQKTKNTRAGFLPRQSIGVGIFWRSPFGPIRLSFAQAVTKQSYDDTQVFQISGGTSF